MADAAKPGAYRDGDFLVRFVGCDADANRSCDGELTHYYDAWKKKTLSRA